MINTPSVVFAIYPNNRGFGFVCLENQTNLLDYGIFNAKPLNNEKILDRIFRQLHYYRPKVVILHSAQGKYARNGDRIKKLIEAIASYAASQKLEVYRYSREQIKDTFGLWNANTKHEISQLLITQFEDLAHLKMPLKQWYQMENYSAGIFDALSLAVTHNYVKE